MTRTYKVLMRPKSTEFMQPNKEYTFHMYIHGKLEHDEVKDIVRYDFPHHELDYQTIEEVTTTWNG